MAHALLLCLQAQWNIFKSKGGTILSGGSYLPIVGICRVDGHLPKVNKDLSPTVPKRSNGPAGPVEHFQIKRGTSLSGGSYLPPSWNRVDGHLPNVNEGLSPIVPKCSNGPFLLDMVLYTGKLNLIKN